MINKTIHYCWFGRNPLTEKAKYCINSWKKYCPDYEIVEWNEDNFDVNSIVYTKEAYEQKKYAFVSDYARYNIIYNNGGIYMDVDVELIKPIDELLEMPFLGYESKGWVNPGLIMGGDKGMPFYKKVLDYYRSLTAFSMQENIVDITTRMLVNEGMDPIGEMTEVCGIKIFPMEYFNPKGENFGKPVITGNTYSIHHYDASWKSPMDKKLMNYRSKFGRKLGTIAFIFVHPIYSLKKRLKKC